MAKVVIEERPNKRLVIDVDRDRHRLINSTTITFEHEDIALAAAAVVREWVDKAILDRTPRAFACYLPDLILEHASEWGLQ